MKFKSEKDLLVEALAAASRVTSRTPGPTFGLLLTLTGNQLTITGTDLETTVRVTLDVIVGGLHSTLRRRRRHGGPQEPG